MTPAPVELDYLEETGPGIAELPQGAAPPAALPAGDPVEAPAYPGWSEETIETFCKGTGAGIHMLVGQTDQDWLMTEKDIERIVPPLARICNRWEPALRLSPVADPLLVAHGFALYGWRSALEAKRAQRDAEEDLVDVQPAGYVREEDAGQQEPPPDLGDVAPEDLDQPGYFDQ